MEVNQEAGAMKIQSTIDSAVMDVKNIVSQYENKMNAVISSAQAKTAQAKPNGQAQPAQSVDVTALQKMHQELLSSVGAIVQGLSAMSGKRSISVTLPGGETASAEVVTQ